MLIMIVAAALLSACLGGANATPTPDIRFGQLVTAKGLGDKNAPQNITTNFNSTDTIYAVVQVDKFPSGHRIFARWTPPDSQIEDTDQIVANQDYSNTYLEFHITGQTKPLISGQYKVQLIVDGNPGASTTFTVS